MERSLMVVRLKNTENGQVKQKTVQDIEISVMELELDTTQELTKGRRIKELIEWKKESGIKDLIGDKKMLDSLLLLK